jgi:hypothetical protein
MHHQGILLPLIQTSRKDLQILLGGTWGAKRRFRVTAAGEGSFFST